MTTMMSSWTIGADVQSTSAILDPSIQLPSVEHPRVLGVTVVSQRAVAMLHAILPLSIITFPLASLPCHFALALTPVAHEVPNILDAVGPCHFTKARHAILREMTTVDGTVRAYQLALSVRTTSLKVAAVARTLWPGHDAMPGAHALHITALESGAVWPILLANAMAEIVLPFAVVPSAIAQRQRSLSMPLLTMKLPIVSGAVRICHLAGSFLRSSPWGAEA